MQSADVGFTGSIPALYDRYLGPALFEPYAIDLAGRLADLAIGDLLEVAAGTGRATRALARTLSQAVTITATDLNQAMVDFAVTQPGTERVSWRQADALALPFADGCFDAVVCQFGVMFFPDKIGGYREALRVLKPGGRFVFNVWDRIEANDFAQATIDSVRAVFPADPPTFLARTPHGYHRTDAITDELHAAGFTSVTLDTVAHTSRLSSPRDLAIGFCQGSPLRNEIEARRPGAIAAVTDAATAGVAARPRGGPIAGRMQAHVIVASR